MSPFIQQIRRCTICQRFGHTKSICHLAPEKCICEFCGQCGHESSFCVERFPRCINCLRVKLDDVDHRASHSGCLSLLRQRAIKKIMAHKSVDPREAGEYLRNFCEIKNLEGIPSSPITLNDFLPKIAILFLLMHPPLRMQLMLKFSPMLTLLLTFLLTYL